MVAATLLAAPSAQAGVATYTSTDVPDFVPNGGSTDSTVAVPGGRTAIQAAEVTGIGYSWAASGQELSAQLVAPDGTTLTLWEVGCADYPAAASFTITDNATQIPPFGQLPNCDSDPLFGGSFLPDDPQNRRLSIFAGKAPVGTWRLRSNDNGVMFANQGTLLRWALRVTHAAPTLTAAGPGTANVRAALALTATADADGTVTIGGDANPGTANISAGIATQVPFTPSKPILNKVKKKGKAQATVSLGFTDQTGGTATSSVSVTLKGKKKKKKRKKNQTR